MNRKRISLVVVLVVAGLWLSIGAGLAGSLVTATWFSRNSNQSTARHDGNTTSFATEADISAVAKKVGPSVVSIVTTTGGRGLRSMPEQQAAGTGMIISGNGYIMTNKHVIAGAERVEIITSDGKKYSDVRLAGVDPLNDIAFLQIKGVNAMPAVELGDSSSVKVGQGVVAIGNSLGQYQNTVTSGIISGKGRPVTASDETGSRIESLTDLLQTDAAINPGNSGGPLLNASGQVIGINTAIAQDAQGIGFAIPINATKGLIKSLFDTGKIKKAFLGVQYMSITPEVRAEYDLPETQGALVKASRGQVAVSADGPAAKAGLREDDIIVKINERAIGDDGGLASLVSEYVPGDVVTLTILRAGESQTVKLTLGLYQP